tara:strand:- start:228 stop:428 length:201 start_codon:yes stop_codon:yes gene_type:complete
MNPTIRNIFLVVGVSMMVNNVIASVRGLDARVSLQCSSAEYLKASNNPKDLALLEFCEQEGYYTGR